MEQSPLPAPPGRQLLRDPPTTFYHPGWVPLAVLNPSGTHGAGTGGGGDGEEQARGGTGDTGRLVAPPREHLCLPKLRLIL